MLSHAQNNLYWREWQAAKRALMPGRSTWTKLEENTRRHALTIAALGHDKSHLDFTNADFDAVLGALRAISRPDDLNAQLRQAGQAHRRAWHVIKDLMRQLCVNNNYVQAIVDRMNEHGALSASRLEDLAEPDLKKVIIALRRKEVGQRQRKLEPVEAPF